MTIKIKIKHKRYDRLCFNCKDDIATHKLIIKQKGLKQKYFYCDECFKKMSLRLVKRGEE